MEGDISQKLLKENKGAEVTVVDEVTLKDRALQKKGSEAAF